MTNDDAKILTDKGWVSGKGWVQLSNATPEDLAELRDSSWRYGRPPETLKGISRAKRRMVDSDLTLKELERLVVDDQDLGANERRQLLVEVRWFADFAARRRASPD